MVSWMPIVCAVLATATWRNTKTSTIVAVFAIAFGILRGNIQTSHEVPEQGAIFVTDASNAIGWDAAHAIAGTAVEGKRSNFRYHVYAGVTKTSDFTALKHEENITPIMVNMSDIYTLAMAYQQISLSMAKTGKGLGRLVGIVNTASFRGAVIPCELMRPEHYERTLHENFIGPTFLIMKWLPSIKALRGRIINVGSVFGTVALPLLQPHSASHAAMESYMDSLRMEMSIKQVMVSQIRVGWFKEQGPPDKGMYRFFARDKEPTWADSYRILFDKASRVANAGMYKSDGMKGVEEVSKAIVHAVTDFHPRTKYTVGYALHPWMDMPLLREVPAVLMDWGRSLCIDRVFDYLMSYW